MAAPKIVIVGGGIGGVSAAQQLAKANFADVTVIDRWVTIRAKFCSAYLVRGACDGSQSPAQCIRDGLMSGRSSLSCLLVLHLLGTMQEGLL